MKWVSHAAALLAGVLLAVIIAFVAKPATAMEQPLDVSTFTPTATMTPKPSETARPTATHTPTITPTPMGEIPALGLSGEVRCWNCAPFQVRVHLTNYDPMSGDINCFDFDEEKQYCYSPTSSLIHWKSLWGFGAACPMEWPLGTWVQIEGIGAFLCMDRGDLVYCQGPTGNPLCNVDIMGPGGHWWNGGDFIATLWVPLDPPRKD